MGRSLADGDGGRSAAGLDSAHSSISRNSQPTRRPDSSLGCWKCSGPDLTMAWTVDSDRVSIPATFGSSTKIGLKDTVLVLFMLFLDLLQGLYTPL